VLWSPDGTKLATGGHGGAKIWNVATGTQIGPNLNHGNRTKLIAWTPDGTLLITQADNNSVKLWNIATGTQIGADLYNDPDDLINVTLSPDGSKLAGIIGSNNEAEIIDLTTRHRIRYAFYTDRLFSLVWSPDGTQLATVGSDNGRSYPVKIFDAASGTQIGRNLAEVSKGNAWMFGFGKLIAWSPNGAQLATVFDSDQSTNQRYGITITFWNVATRSKINPNIKMQDEYFRAMAWNPNGTKLAVSHWRGLKIFNVTTRKEVSPSIKGEAASVVRALAWSPDSSKLAITSGPGFGWSIIRSFSIVDFLKNLNINQCHLLQAFEQMFYREQFGKPPMPIQATALQWETFVSLPESIQRKLRRFITQQLNHI
jgi:WD40 repeat protein